MRPLVALLALWLSLAASSAWAQATPSDADRGAALAMLDAGIAAAEDGDWESARVAFMRAYSLVASTRVLMNLAGAQRHTGRLVDAAASYRRWLLDATARDEPYRPTVEQALRELATETPEITVSVRGAVAGDVVEIDGERVEIGTAIAVDPGEHVAEVIRASAAMRSERVTVAPSDRHEVAFVMPSLAPVDVTPARTTTLVHEQTNDDVLDSPWLWLGVGAGAVVIIVVVIAIAVAASSSAGPVPMPDMGTLGPFHL